MTTRQTSIDEDDFQAFVDGQLPPEQRRAVMAYLAARPEESARMSDYRNLSGELHQLYDEVLHEPLPARLRVERYRRTSWSARALGWLGLAEFGMAPQAATAIVLLVLGGTFGGWMLNDHYSQPEPEAPAVSFIAQALNAHVLYAPDQQHPVEFGADQENSFLLWMSERLGQAVHAPDLADLGFTLVGGRLLPAASQPAAQLMYENPDAQRITLYIRIGWTSLPGAAQEGTINFTGEDGVSAVYWMDGPLAYALGGELDREQLFAIAKIIQQQRAVPTPPTPEQTATTEKGAT
jgi:anti-sigma factor RsiW